MGVFQPGSCFFDITEKVCSLMKQSRIAHDLIRFIWRQSPSRFAPLQSGSGDRKFCCQLLERHVDAALQSLQLRETQPLLNLPNQVGGMLCFRTIFSSVAAFMAFLLIQLTQSNVSIGRSQKPPSVRDQRTTPSGSDLPKTARNSWKSTGFVRWKSNPASLPRSMSSVPPRPVSSTALTGRLRLASAMTS